VRFCDDPAHLEAPRARRERCADEIIARMS
jgi:hypothetical protein